jgi:phytoene dehydrogenase-like protein
MRAVIIGSGMAGLTAGATLARAGQTVTILEQYPQPGGVTAGYAAHGYHWDLGQLLLEGFGPDEPSGAVLAALGVGERVQIRKDDRGYVFPDFEIRKPEKFGGPRWRMHELARLFPADARGLERYWRDYLRFSAVMTRARRMETAHGAGRLLAQAGLYLSLLPLLPKLGWSAARLMDDFFQSKQLQGVFITILADFFTPPSKFQGLGVFAINPEPAFDCRQPVTLANGAEQLYHYSVLGGMQSVTAALLEQVAAHGGQVLTGRAARKVLIENGRASAVQDASGETHPADVVVASGGVNELFFDLVGEQYLPPGFAGKVRSIPLMDSVFMLHLGVDYDPSPWLHGVCTYFYGTYDVEGEVTRAKAGEYHDGAAGFVVHAPSLHSPGMVPPGCHALTIYTICPDRLKDGDWASRKQEFADKLLEHAEKRIPGLREHMQVCEIFTPDDFRTRTGLARYAFGGLAPHMGAFRAPHQTPIPGLWFVGAQSESGGGVNAVIPAAYKTAQKILARKDI